MSQFITPNSDVTDPTWTANTDPPFFLTNAGSFSGAVGDPSNATYMSLTDTDAYGGGVYDHVGMGMSAAADPLVNTGFTLHFVCKADVGFFTVAGGTILALINSGGGNAVGIPEFSLWDYRNTIEGSTFVDLSIPLTTDQVIAIRAGSGFGSFILGSTGCILVVSSLCGGGPDPLTFYLSYAAIEVPNAAASTPWYLKTHLSGDGSIIVDDIVTGDEVPTEDDGYTYIPYNDVETYPTEAEIPQRVFKKGPVIIVQPIPPGPEWTELSSLTSDTATGTLTVGSATSGSEVTLYTPTTPVIQFGKHWKLHMFALGARAEEES